MKPLSPTDFLIIATSAIAGAYIEYYRGLLAHDMLRSGAKRLPAWKLLHMARALLSYGVVTLVQKRVSEDDYIYYAVRSNKKAVPPVLKVVARDLDSAIKVRKPSPWWQDGTG